MKANINYTAHGHNLNFLNFNVGWVKFLPTTSFKKVHYSYQLVIFIMKLTTLV